MEYEDRFGVGRNGCFSLHISIHHSLTAILATLLYVSDPIAPLLEVPYGSVGPAMVAGRWRLAQGIG